MSLRTPIGKVRGLGSAKEGTHHWLLQRITAIALVPLTLWFAFSVACLAGAPYAQFTGWLASPLNTALLVLFLVSLFWHSMLGVQVVVEDYVHAEFLKVGTLIVLKLAHIALGVATILAVLRIAFTGGQA